MAESSKYNEQFPHRVIARVPGIHVNTVVRMLGALTKSKDLTVTPVMSQEPRFTNPQEGSRLPSLFTMLEDEKERLVPAVQRVHIRAFEDHLGDRSGGYAERLIRGIWQAPSRLAFNNDLNTRHKWMLVQDCLVTSPDRFRSVVGIRAYDISRLHALLDGERSQLWGAGAGTLGFLGQLASATETQLASQVDNRGGNL